MATSRSTSSSRLLRVSTRVAASRRIAVPAVSPRASSGAIRSRVACAYRTLAASPARVASSSARRAAASASSTWPSSARARASAPQTAPLRVTEQPASLRSKLCLADAEGPLCVAAIHCDPSDVGDRASVGERVAPRREGRQARLHTPRQLHQARRHGGVQERATPARCREGLPQSPPAGPRAAAPWRGAPARSRSSRYPRRSKQGTIGRGRAPRESPHASPARRLDRPRARSSASASQCGDAIAFLRRRGDTRLRPR